MTTLAAVTIDASDTPMLWYIIAIGILAVVVGGWLAISDRTDEVTAWIGAALFVCGILAVVLSYIALVSGKDIPLLAMQQALLLHPRLS